MADPMVFQFVGETVENATNAFVGPAAARLMIALQMIALTGVTLYITLTGYATLSGSVQSPFWTWLKQCIKIGVIAAFALGADNYATYVVEGFRGLESGLADAMNLSSSGPTTTIYQVLDQSLGKGLDIVAQCFEKSNAAGFEIGAAIGWAIAGLTVGAGTLAISVLGAGVVVVAKFSLAIVFGLGPFFILCLMFPVTARFFDAWVAQVLNYTFTVVIMAVVMSFAMKAFDTFIAASDFSGSGDDSPMWAALQIAAVCGVLFWIIAQVGGIASGLAGGVSMAAMGMRQFAMPVTGSLSAARGAANLVNPASTRRDMQSGQMVTARRANHLMAGNTAWNPAYRQHVMGNSFKNWGRAKGGRVSGS